LRLLILILFVAITSLTRVRALHLAKLRTSLVLLAVHTTPELPPDGTALGTDDTEALARLLMVLRL